MKERRHFQSLNTWERYVSYRERLGPAAQAVYDAKVVECDCDYGTPSCNHYNTSPERVYAQIKEVEEAVRRDMRPDYD